MFKRIILLLVAAFVLLAAIVVTRAAMFTSKQAAVTPIVKLDIDLDAAAQRLSKAVTFKTVSYEDPAQSDASQFDGMHAFMAEAYPKTHAALKMEKVGAQSLLYTLARFGRVAQANPSHGAPRRRSRRSGNRARFGSRMPFPVW